MNVFQITYGNDEEFAWSAGGSFITINELSQNYTMVNYGNIDYNMRTNIILSIIKVAKIFN